MASELDIYRAANMRIEQHGETAHIAAAQRIEELDGQGDLDGVAVWRRIKRAVQELQRTEPEWPVN